MQTESAEHYRSFSDEKLLSLMVEKDACAVEVLYDRHAQAIFQVLHRIVHNAEAAEDLLQETFWQVWQKAEQYNGSGPASSWIFRVARNKAIDHLRWQKVRPHTISNPLEMIEPTQPLCTDGVDAEVEARWVEWQLQQAMDRLPGEQRLCLELAYFQGMSQSEIAEHTQMPLGTIKTRMRIGMEKLGRLLYRTSVFAGAS